MAGIGDVLSIKMRGGTELPMLGFGTYQIPPRVAQSCVEQALSLGYRAIDTAQCYGNEAQVGYAIKASGLSRQEVFVTTKTWTDGYRSTKAGIERSASLLGGYIDLLLVHEPTSDIEGMWRALEEARDTGTAQAIGVSNFLEDSLGCLLRIARVIPEVDQVETHVLRQQRALQGVLAESSIVLQSWSPLVCGRAGITRNPLLAQIARDHGKTPAQVALRWLIQRGIPLNVKSVHADRMAENLSIFDFQLSLSEMEAVRQLDTNCSQFGWW